MSRRLAPPALLVASLVAADARADDAAYPRLWIGVSGSIDLSYVRSAIDVCQVASDGTPSIPGYACATPTGDPFASAQQRKIVGGTADSVSSGVSTGNARGLVSLDYAVTPNVLVGGRAGYVAWTYPVSHASAPLGPTHFEGRVTYVAGDAPLARVGFAPVAFAAVGLAPYDVRVTTAVVESGVRGLVPAAAWATGGPFFLGVGAGVRCALSPRIAVVAAARATLAVGGGTIPSLAPELALQVGF